MYVSSHFGPIDQDRLSTLSGPELVTLLHEIDPACQTKRFSSRTAGIKRVSEALKHQNVPSKSVKKRLSTQMRLLNLPAKDEIRPHRPTTRRGKIISLASRPEGATFSELILATEWTKAELKVTLRMINSYLGHGIEEKVDGRVFITGTPLKRKVFNLKRKDEIKDHRPGTKRALVVSLLTRGASFEEIKDETGWNDAQAFQGIKLINTYLGHGIQETENGVIALND